MWANDIVLYLNVCSDIDYLKLAEDGVMWRLMLAALVNCWVL